MSHSKHKITPNAGPHTTTFSVCVGSRMAPHGMKLDRNPSRPNRYLWTRASMLRQRIGYKITWLREVAAQVTSRASWLGRAFANPVSDHKAYPPFRVHHLQPTSLLPSLKRTRDWNRSEYQKGEPFRRQRSACAASARTYVRKERLSNRV